MENEKLIKQLVENEELFDGVATAILTGIAKMIAPIEVIKENIASPEFKIALRKLHKACKEANAIESRKRIEEQFGNKLWTN